MQYLITTAFITGLIGSLHCVGMCGPLAMGIPFFSIPKHKVYIAMFLYNFGRAVSYSLLGFLIGLLGSFAAIVGWLQALSIASGITIALLAVTQISIIPKFKWVAKFHQIIAGNLAKLIHHNTFSSFLKIGLLNGLLPCGLVYIALLTSLIAGNAFKSMLFMFVFGMGTFPLMFAWLLLNYKLSINFRKHLQKIIPVFALFMGCILILRGLNLNIPFISPKFLFEAQKVAVSCH